jgi:hypothetical protein
MPAITENINEIINLPVHCKAEISWLHAKIGFEMVTGGTMLAIVRSEIRTRSIALKTIFRSIQ